MIGAIEKREKRKDTREQSRRYRTAGGDPGSAGRIEKVGFK